MDRGSAPIPIKTYFALGPNALMLDIAGPCEVLRGANMVQNQWRYEVQFVSATPNAPTSLGYALENVAPLPEHIEPDAMVVVCGNASEMPGFANMPANQDTRSADTQLETWLRRTIASSHQLVTVCSGALHAARAGLFDGKHCTTHHKCLDELRAISQKIKVEENRLYVEDGHRFSSAGITSGIDLMLHIVGKRLGLAATAQIAQHMVVFNRRSGNEPQLSPFLQGRSHLHPTIHRIQDQVTTNPTKDWTVERLANEAHMSTRHFSRLFNKETGVTVPDYINGLRIAMAENMLKAQHVSIENLVDRLGYNSTRQFHRAWKQRHGKSPRQWQREQAVEA
ncbi:GlxA family transcriptional regulator [Maritalea myrionectae]|uniref:GlxA family transcriptional regulator n=1 Tax=Maritalea myrionectae TaxID=454601 RepID=UPI000402724C|nr:helix-turn-helix domain-containing protein [Maritalea myrionectae]